MREGFLRLCALAACLAAGVCRAGDGIDRNARDFVRASLIVAGPGDGMLASVGHACLRLECPTFQLDNCFTCEHEPARLPFLSVFFERLGMGLFVVPTEKFLAPYASAGREVTAYPLNLPPEVKTRLWQLLDEEAAKGGGARYDYVENACTQAVVRELMDALKGYPCAERSWPDRYMRTRREIFADALATRPWERAFLHMVVGTAFDKAGTFVQKVILPTDLVDYLQGLSVGPDHQRVLDKAGVKTLVSNRRPPEKTPWVTPTRVAALLVVLSLVNLVRRVPGLTAGLLCIQAVIAVFLTYFYGFSHLPTTNWNWLLVPFNPLPLAAWRWRRYFAVPYAVLLLGWTLGLAAAPHQLTDPAYLVLAVACAMCWSNVDGRLQVRILRWCEERRRMKT